MIAVPIYQYFGYAAITFLILSLGLLSIIQHLKQSRDGYFKGLVKPFDSIDIILLKISGFSFLIAIVLGIVAALLYAIFI